MARYFVEKRRYERVLLDVPFFISVKAGENEALPAQLLDCSRGGVQLAFSPMEAGVGQLLNREVLVLGLPRVMDPEQKGLKGFIAWVGSVRCGVRFDTPLAVAEEELREIAAQL